MNNNVAELIVIFIIFGWIPILSIGKAVSMCIREKTCNKCTCKNCLDMEVGNERD